MLVALALAAVAWADCSDPDDAPLPAEDCDGDGWLVSDGDCDDDDEDANPGEDELCEVPGDEDCDGFVDDGCDRALQRGSIQGGSACAVAPASSGVLGAAAVGLLIVRRRRRAC